MAKATRRSTEAQILATSIVENYKITNTKTDVEMSEKLGLSKVTYYSRIDLNNWKKTEIFYIQKCLQ